tara:strand:+ start:95404 stop:96093 length:690 start_codon:yes stop_codon:yes gene_type:complete
VVIVTGGGSGIGRSAAITLGKQGFRVVIAGRKLEKLEETGELLDEHGVDWVAISGDIAIAQDRQSLIAGTLDEYGQINAIVNNAGLGTCKVLGELGAQEVQDLFSVNTIGPIELVRIAIPELVRSSGCVVNIASIAIVDPFVGLGVYGCAKAAIDGLTRALHNEYGHQGIRAYTIAPGAVETQMLRSIVSEDMLSADQAMTPDRIAELIAGCITGQTDQASGSTMVVNS